MLGRACPTGMHHTQLRGQLPSRARTLANLRCLLCTDWPHRHHGRLRAGLVMICTQLLPSRARALDPQGQLFVRLH